MKDIKHLQVGINMCALTHSVVSDSVTPWTVAHQAPLSMGLFKQEYWSGLPFHSPEPFFIKTKN